MRHDEYTLEELAGALIDYYEKFDKVPHIRDLKNSGYPSPTTFIKYFGSYNKALEYAGLQPHKYTDLSDKSDKCELCGITKTIQWHNKNGLKVCRKCYSSDGNYLKGTLDPKSNIGIRVITEYIVSGVLNSSKKYGNIDIKSGKLRKDNGWYFYKQSASIIPDHYICLGFNEDRTEILRVFVIPRNSNLVTTRGISITNNNSDRTLKYEVDPKPYNSFYKSLNLTTLSEFRNLENNNTNKGGEQHKP